MPSFALPRAALKPSPVPRPFGRITLACGTGRGPTELAAFDAALLDAGVANYNLIYLSSVIPPGSELEFARYRTPAAEYGRRLYVVMSQGRECRPGKSVHAGIGWARDPSRGQGLFAELHDSDVARLDHGLRATLASMQHNRGTVFGPTEIRIASATCKAEPVCALVIAVYGSEPW